VHHESNLPPSWNKQCIFDLLEWDKSIYVTQPLLANHALLNCICHFSIMQSEIIVYDLY